MCPSCSAKRGAGLGAFLIDHIKEDVGHAQWVFTIPKMLRPLFFKMRPLRGHLARLSWETVRGYCQLNGVEASCGAVGAGDLDSAGIGGFMPHEEGTGS